jgi:hypothetical protein
VVIGWVASVSAPARMHSRFKGYVTCICFLSEHSCMLNACICIYAVRP